MENLFLTVGSEKSERVSDAQIWPHASNSIIGEQEDKICLIIADLGSNNGGGLVFINGFAFLQRFHSVYDTMKCQVGFAIPPSSQTPERT
ncbi:hypothetical protein Hypma_016346 [Hypsizygus marmoreus]|uniref:Peptidase A1 domain-containing protein n=1 Tax=Hypsizygus marmoreus TaxID=39966 RepID=A0A369IY74_HYPMA|nr:hypothetical protein Hypma_016346 [Hypsizygus marmoreus]